MSHEFIEDSNILWICLAKTGTPDRWRPCTNYKLGDTVVPRFPTLAQADLMFQCVGFIGKSSGTQPTWPVVLNNTVIDNNIEWKAKLPGNDPTPLVKKEYYLIDAAVTVV